MKETTTKMILNGTATVLRDDTAYQMHRLLTRMEEDVLENIFTNVSILGVSEVIGGVDMDGVISSPFGLIIPFTTTCEVPVYDGVPDVEEACAILSAQTLNIIQNRTNLIREVIVSVNDARIYDYVDTHVYNAASYINEEGVLVTRSATDEQLEIPELELEMEL